MLSEVGSKIIKNVGGPTYQCYNVLLHVWSGGTGCCALSCDKRTVFI